MLPIHLDPAPVPDVAPTDSKLRMMVSQLWNGPAAGAAAMKAEHLKD